MSIHNFPNDRGGAQGSSFANAGGPPYDGGMEARVAKVEADLSAIKADLAVVRSNYATKEDLHKEINTLTWRLVTFVCGFGTALVGATYFVTMHVK